MCEWVITSHTPATLRPRLTFVPVLPQPSTWSTLECGEVPLSSHSSRSAPGLSAALPRGCRSGNGAAGLVELEALRCAGGGGEGGERGVSAVESHRGAAHLSHLDILAPFGSIGTVWPQ